MPGYIIVRAQVTNWDKYREYTQVTPEVIARYGGRFIVRGGGIVCPRNQQPVGMGNRGHHPIHGKVGLVEEFSPVPIGVPEHHDIVGNAA